MIKPAKPLDKTMVKLSITDSRLAITVRFMNGTDLKMSSTRFAERLSTSDLGQRSAMQKILDFTANNLAGENNGDRYVRLAKFFEDTTSVPDAALKISMLNCRVNKTVSRGDD